MKQVAGRLRLDLAQFRDLEAFAAFGSDLDKASKAQLDRGQRLVELLKQPQYCPVPGRASGRVDLARNHRLRRRRDVEDVRRFERDWLEFVGRSHQGIYDAILQTGKLDETTVDALKAAVKEFEKGFETAAGGGIEAPADDVGDVEGLEADQRSQEAITRHRQPEAQDAGSSGS